MKKMLLIGFVLFAFSAMAQDEQAAPPAAEGQKPTTNITMQNVAPSYSDLYCSGFLTSETVSHTNKIAGGMYSPEQTLFVRGGTIFVDGGGLQEGAQYSVLREIRDPNRYEPYVGAHAAVAATGQPYDELGRIRVLALRGSVAVAQIEFSCQNMTIGDIVVPFKEHDPVSYRKTSVLARFPAGPGHLSGRIVMAREFDTELRTGQKVYLSTGADKGVKVGDYFRVIRGYDPAKLNAIENMSYKAPVGEDTQKVLGTVTPEGAKTLPVRDVGEMVVLSVTKSSATAMITNALEDIHVGDWIEMEDEQ